MRVAEIALAIGLAGSTGCTLAAIGATSSTIGIHNAAVHTDHAQWSYGAPLLISAAIGAVTDVILLVLLGRQFAKPMT